MRFYSLVLGAAVMAAACQDQTMTGVERSAKLASTRDVIQSSTVANARYAIDDVMTRIVPTLSDANATPGLVAAMQGLQQAADAGRAGDMPGLVISAQAQLERFARDGSADPAEVDAIRLALDSVGKTL